MLRSKVIGLPQAVVAAVLLGLTGCVPTTWLPDSSGFVFVKPIPVKKEDEFDWRWQLVHFDIKQNSSRVVVDDIGEGTRWPAVSPDGKKIAVARFKGETFNNKCVEIVIYDFAGKQIARSKEFAWFRKVSLFQLLAVASLDSGAMLFWSPRDDKLIVTDFIATGIYDVARDDFKLIENATPVLHGGSPFRPDGKGFVASLQDAENKPYRMAFIDMAGVEAAIDIKELEKLATDVSNNKHITVFDLRDVNAPQKPAADAGKNKDQESNNYLAAGYGLASLLLPSGWDGDVAWWGFTRKKVTAQLDTVKKIVRIPDAFKDLDLFSGKSNLLPGKAAPAITAADLAFDFGGDVSIRIEINDDEGAIAKAKSNSLGSKRIVAVNHKTKKEAVLLPKVAFESMFIPSPDGKYVILCGGAMLGGGETPVIAVIDRDGKLISKISFDYLQKVWDAMAAKQAEAAKAVEEAEAAKIAATSKRLKSTPSERAEAFKWFSTLGYPDAKGRTFVRVATGATLVYNCEPPANTYLRGFMLGEKDNHFSCLSLSLVEESFDKRKTLTPPERQVDFEVVDLQASAAAVLQALRAPNYQRLELRRWGKFDLHPRSELFVLAWACWRNGLDEMAAELFDEAAKLPENFDWVQGPWGFTERPREKTLFKVVAEDIADKKMWRIVSDFGDPTKPRTRLLQQFEEFVKSHPESKHSEEAKAAAGLLEQMISEDSDHAKNARKPFGELTKQEQIAELIFQLRDQNGCEYLQPSFCGAMLTPGCFDISNTRWNLQVPLQGVAAGAAEKLVEMDGEAVPQLLQCLDDQRFSRQVHVFLRSETSHHIVRVGDCAFEILRIIAARGFWKNAEEPPVKKYRNGIPGDPPRFLRLSPTACGPRDSETVKEIQKWYLEFLKKGEKQMLMEGVERGDFDSCDQAIRLLRKYPNSALPTILEGIKATQDIGTRNLLVAVLTKIQDDKVLPFLLKEIHEGPFAKGRMLAADSLHRRGRPEAVVAMIAQWQAKRPERKLSYAEQVKADEGPEIGLINVAYFLAACGKVEAIEALAKDLHKQPYDLRECVVRSFGKPMFVQADDFDLRKQPLEIRKAVEKLLIAELDDTEDPLRFSYGGGTFWDFYRNCDSAADALCYLEPHLYAFESGASLRQRNRAIAEMKNVYRKAQGQPLLPVPAPLDISQVPDEKIGTLVKGLLQAANAEKVRRQSEIEELGLGALPGITKILEKTANEGEKVILEKLSRRLATIVDEAVFADKSVHPDVALLTKVAALEGKPFNPEAFADLIRSLTKNPPPGVHAYRFYICRAGDGTGVKIKIDLLDAAGAKQLRGTVGDYGIMFDSREGGNTMFYSSLDEFLEKNGLFERDLTAACATARSEVISFRLTLISDSEK